MASYRVAFNDEKICGTWRFEAIDSQDVEEKCREWLRGMYRHVQLAGDFGSIQPPFVKAVEGMDVEAMVDGAIERMEIQLVEDENE